MHRDFGVVVLPEDASAFQVYRSIAEGGALYAAGYDSDVLGHHSASRRLRQSLSGSCCVKQIQKLELLFRGKK
jgi:hypothetical protein